MAPHILLPGTPGQFPNYESALLRAGAVPCFSGTTACDGLLLPGGGDIHPRFYSAPWEDCRNVDEARDLRELGLAASYFAAGKPILGICRGLQVLNVVLGGTLLQDVEGHGQIGGADSLHETRAAGFVRELYGPRFAVNTAHHQAVDRLGQGLQAVQWTADGVVEAAAHSTAPVWGVQWHPERLSEGGRYRDTVDGGRLLAWFVDQCVG